MMLPVFTRAVSGPTCRNVSCEVVGTVRTRHRPTNDGLLSHRVTQTPSPALNAGVVYGDTQFSVTIPAVRWRLAMGTKTHELGSCASSWWFCCVCGPTATPSRKGSNHRPQNWLTEWEHEEL